MPKLEFDPKDLKVIITVNDAPLRTGVMRSRVEAVLRLLGIETRNLIKISKFVPRNLGTLANSFIVREKFGDEVMEIIVGTPLAYGIVMEAGRTPGERFPPDEAIREWIIQKGIFQSALDDLITGAKEQGIKLPVGLSGFRRARGLGGLAGLIIRGGEKRAEAAGTAANLLEGLVFMISRSIAQKGIPGHFFLKRINAVMRPRFKSLIEEALAG